MKSIIPLILIGCLINIYVQSMHPLQIVVLSAEQRMKLKDFMIKQAALTAAEKLHAELISRRQYCQNADRLTVRLHDNNTMVEIKLSLVSDRSEPLETIRYISAQDFQAIVDHRAKSEKTICCC